MSGKLIVMMNVVCRRVGKGGFLLLKAYEYAQEIWQYENCCVGTKRILICENIVTNVNNEGINSNQDNRSKYSTTEHIMLINMMSEKQT